MNESFLAKLAQTIQAFRQGTLSIDLFNQQTDALFASSSPLTLDTCERARLLVRKSDLPPAVSDSLLLKLEGPANGPKTRRFEARVEGIEQALGAKRPESKLKQPVAVDASGDSSGGSNPDSSLSRRLLDWQEGGSHKKLQSNETIRGTYRLVSRVGKGGMGEVWKAIDLIADAGESRDKYVAIKFLGREIRNHRYALKALVREFARYKKLIHPNLVRAYELNRDEDAVFIVMEFLPGMPLNQFIREHPDGISLNTAKPIIQGMCDALAFAHNEGVIHLDFKPGNVFHNPETGMTKVIDFGIARLADKKDRDQTLFDPGALRAKTKSYATPEMLADLDPVPSDDIYGLCCVIYELLTGEHPFNRIDAISAESRGLSPEPIKGLGKAQFKALERGLAFRRKNRTQSVEKFYRELFPESKPSEWKLPGRVLTIALIILALIIAPFLWQGFNQWRIGRIAAGVQQMSAESVDDFLTLDTARQLDLLVDESTRTALVKHFIAQATPERNALDFIQELQPAIQKSLFRTRDIRTLLITHTVNMIDLAVQEDNFALATRIAENIAAQYPDSRQLAEQSALVKNAKGKRLLELTRSFDHCLYDRKRALLELLPCLTDSADRLKRVDESLKVLNNPQLTNRFIREIGEALSADNLDEASKLLIGWRILNPFESEERAELTAEWQRKNEIMEWATRFNNASDAELDGLIGNFGARGEEIRKQVLEFPQVRDKILSWYGDRALQFADSGRYADAATTIAHAKEVLSENRSALNSLDEMEQNIGKYRTEKIKTLTERYWKYLRQQELDSDALLALNQEIRKLDPQHELLDYPRLSETYAEKVEDAIEQGRFDLADRYLQGWSVLSPASRETEAYTRLKKKLAGAIRSSRKRNDRVAAIENDIAAARIEDSLAKIDGLEEDFSTDERTEILESIKPSLLAKISEVIDIAISNQDYVTAQNLIDAVSKRLPDEKQITDFEKRTNKARSERISELVAGYWSLLDADVLEGSALFRELAAIDSLDKQYLVQHPNLYKKLGERIKTVVGSDHPIVALQDVFVHWESFLRDTDSSKEARKIFRSTKNFIALRCLFRAKMLKREGKNQRADEYVMFGLSLNPSERITDSLTRELTR